METFKKNLENKQIGNSKIGETINNSSQNIHNIISKFSKNLEILQKGGNLYNIIISLGNQSPDFIKFLIEKSENLNIIKEKNYIGYKEDLFLVLNIGGNNIKFNINKDGEILKVFNHQYYTSINLPSEIQELTKKLLNNI